MLLLHFLPISY